MGIDFPEVEQDVLRRWQEIDAFRTQVRLSTGRKPFTFYDGPPFGMHELEPSYGTR